ncbi:MAG: hypothetical protein SVR04_18440, partial [Spirochaetota bacterium]|nr:hypothetical protein [Spirochaetota bacterium]
MVGKMERRGKNGFAQSEFPFGGRKRAVFRGHRAADLARLPASVLCLSPRGEKWLAARKIKRLGGLVEMVQKRMLAKSCVDQSLRREITLRVKPFWDGHAYRSIIAVSLLSCGVERVLCGREAGSQPVSVLGLSAALGTWLKVKEIRTLRDLIL